MKMKTKLFGILLLVFAVTQFSFAQGWNVKNAAVENGDGYKSRAILFKGTIDTTVNSYASKSFSLSGFFGGQLSTNPVSYRYKNTSASGKAIVTHLVQANYGDGTWFTVDTLAFKDSSETNVTGTIDFNNKIALAYRLLSYGETSGVNKNPPDTISEVTFYLYRKD